MRFFYAKKDWGCFYCKNTIFRGEATVRLNMKDKHGLLFHPECFQRWNEETFVRRFLEWKRESTPRPKLGRPLVPCRDRKKRRQLLSLLTYHRKTGNIDRAKEIEAGIKELEDGN